MRNALIHQLRPALTLFGLLALITGLLYPLAITGLAQLIFPARANGSWIHNEGQAIGSELIGQPFSDPSYFWGRPSATAPFGYNAAASTGSNLGSTNPALYNAVQARIDALRQVDPGNLALVPVDLVTASGSGLDPHISIAAALYQIPRVARARGISEVRLLELVRAHIEGRQLGFLGEARINVLKLNLALQAMP